MKNGILCKDLRKSLLLLGAIAVLTTGCKKDPNIIPESKLVPLLADLEIAEAYSRHPSGEFPYSRDSIGLAVLKAHDVSPAMMDSTLGYYGRNADDYMELYNKVQRELDNRMRDIAHASAEMESDSRNIWSLSPYVRFTSNDLNKGLSFSIPTIEMTPGEIVEWKFRVASGGQMEALLGVEYTDGAASFITSNLYNRKSTSIDFQTDTAKNVSRLFGFIKPVNSSVGEISVIDSISLSILPLDSASYYKIRQQRNYKLRNHPPRKNQQSANLASEEVEGSEEVSQTNSGRDEKRRESNHLEVDQQGSLPTPDQVFSRKPIRRK